MLKEMVTRGKGYLMSQVNQICYDMERTDALPIIEPCQCKGDVGGVHHECLRRWLLEVRGS